jgi:bile acid:Na+ symporter, BASS family
MARFATRNGCSITTDQLTQLINILAPITLFEMMMAIGLGVTVGDVVSVAANWRLVSRAAIASYLCVPAAAAALLILFQANAYAAVGFLIIAVCPGAPYGPPFTALAKGNVPVAVGLMVVLAGSSALAAPLLLAILLPQVLRYLPALPEEAGQPSIDAGTVATMLLVAQFLPLCLGLALKHYRPALASILRNPANRISTALNLTLLGLIFWAQFDMLVGVPLRAYAGMLALVLASVAAAWVLSDSTNRSAMVMATSVRNVGVCLVIATATFAGTPAVAAVTAFGLFQTILMALVALAWARAIYTTAADRGAAVADQSITGAAS